jgi:putative tryptophan/tyrosine transport system substrate-binding protein
MRRRDFIALTIGAILAPVAAGAETEAKWHLGLIHVGLDHEPSSLPLLRQTLNDLGYEEGADLRFDWRNQPDETAAEATAREFVNAGVDLIVAFEDQSVRAAQTATTQVPIVFLHVVDPVASGYVKSFSRPGGNTTGFVSFPRGLVPKQLEILKEFVPGLRHVLLLVDPTDPATERELKWVRQANSALHLVGVEQAVSTEQDVEKVFAALGPDVQAVLVVSPSLMQKFPSLIVKLASAKRLPIPAHRKNLVEAGALFSYAPVHSRVGRPAAQYIDRILKGESPADLPVQEVSEITLIVSRKTAKTLGLAVPTSLLVRADEVID